MHINLLLFLLSNEAQRGPPSPHRRYCNWGLQQGEKAAELLRGSQIIFGLEQTSEKGKGVCVKEKAGRGKGKREGAQMETKKDKTMWVFGSTLKGSIWKENNAGLVSGSMNIYRKLYTYTRM